MPRDNYSQRMAKLLTSDAEGQEFVCKMLHVSREELERRYRAEAEEIRKQEKLLMPLIEWQPSPELIAQLAHYGWGALIVMIFASFGHVWWGVLASVAWASVKEFVFDTYVERAPFKDNLQDFSFYMLGMSTALCITSVSKFC